ncbi:MAG: L,D-transpeptidase family protein [Pseudomonadota bacterium]
MRIAALACAAFFLFDAQSIAGEEVVEPRWDAESARALIEFAEHIDAEGLDPNETSIATLKEAQEDGDAVAVEIAASSLFERIARDLRAGTVPTEQRVRWRMGDPPLDGAAIGEAMNAALDERRVADALAAFAPPHAGYRALKDALRKTPADDEDLRNVIRLNMERWRWMPRELGTDYVLVNVPSYELVVVRDGAEISRRRVIVGAKKTPTPQIAAVATGLAFNPTWFVPASIVAESVGALIARRPKEAERLGYYAAPDGTIRQKPGPHNALGAVKLLMANPYGVFLHDTPNKDAFDRDARALSHGCIRVDGALEFAGDLLGPDWTAEMIAEIIATDETVTAEFEKPLPIYIAYFTAAANEAGEVARHPDIYGLDKPLIAAMSKHEADAPPFGENKTCSGSIAP